jgi:hypothetical protein
MPVSIIAKRYLRGVTIALLGVAVAVLGITAVGLFSDYFEAHPLSATFMLSNSLGIDVIGAIVPMIVCFAAAALYIKYSKAPTRRLSLVLLASFAAAFLLYHVTDLGIAGSPLLLALTVGAFAGAVTVFPKPLADLRRNFVSSLMLTTACVPLSIFVVDLLYSRYFACAAIGGNGLADGLLLSILYAPLAVTAVFSVIIYVLQTVRLVADTRIASVKSNSKMLTPVIENSKAQA